MILEITSPQNPRIKDVIRLRDRRGRQRQQRFIIDGLRELERACNASISIEAIYFNLDACQSTLPQEILSQCELDGTELIKVSERVMEKLSYGQRQLSMIAVARTPAPHELVNLDVTSDSLIIILEAIEKPGNLGAIVRTADASGVCAVIVAEGSADIYNPNAIRSSCGAIFHLPVIHAELDSLQSWLKTYNFQTLATRVDGAISYTDANYSGPTAVVMGTEATGLSSAWHNGNSTAINIPMLGTGDSLNVSTSCAVVCFEALRQRSQS